MAAPLPLGTVVWFGSLEFMSLGYDYDMVLLPPRAPSDSDSSPRCQRRGRHRAITVTTFVVLIACVGHERTLVSAQGPRVTPQALSSLLARLLG
jgi:hypothetical protein